MYFCIRDSSNLWLEQWGWEEANNLFKKLVRNGGLLLLYNSNLVSNQFWHCMNNYRYMLFSEFPRKHFISTLSGLGVLVGDGQLGSSRKDHGEDSRRNGCAYRQHGHISLALVRPSRRLPRECRTCHRTVGEGARRGHTAATCPTGDWEVATDSGVAPFQGAPAAGYLTGDIIPVAPGLNTRLPKIR